MKQRLPVTVNLTAYHGDTWSQPFRFLKNDVPVDLNSVSIKSSARRLSTSSISQLNVEIEPDPGLLMLSLPSEIHPGTYAYDIQITDSDNQRKTWVKGELVVEKDVTSDT